jgi:hypothetical protein
MSTPAMLGGRDLGAEHVVDAVLAGSTLSPGISSSTR